MYFIGFKVNGGNEASGEKKARLARELGISREILYQYLRHSDEGNVHDAWVTNTAHEMMTFSDQDYTSGARRELTRPSRSIIFTACHSSSLSFMGPSPEMLRGC